jgi:hypothetical protein
MAIGFGYFGEMRMWKVCPWYYGSINSHFNIPGNTK